MGKETRTPGEGVPPLAVPARAGKTLLLHERDLGLADAGRLRERGAVVALPAAPVTGERKRLSSQVRTKVMNLSEMLPDGLRASLAEARAECERTEREASASASEALASAGVTSESPRLDQTRERPRSEPPGRITSESLRPESAREDELGQTTRTSSLSRPSDERAAADGSPRAGTALGERTRKVMNSTRVMPIEELFPGSIGERAATPADPSERVQPADGARQVISMIPGRSTPASASAASMLAGLRRLVTKREARLVAGVLTMAVLGGRLWSHSMRQEIAIAPTTEAAPPVLSDPSAQAATPAAVDEGAEAPADEEQALVEGEEVRGDVPEAADVAATGDGDSRAPERNVQRPHSDRRERREARRHARPVARRAVDSLAAGDLPSAVTAYESLAAAEPDQPAYAEAARILRSRMAAREGP